MTTKPTIEANLATGHIVTAAEWNTNVLQEALYVQEVLAGTNTDKIPGTALGNPLTLQGECQFSADANLYIQLQSSNPVFSFDANDYLTYIRATNLWQLNIASTLVLQADGNGSLTGKGFYASSEVAIANGAGANFAHGLGARPRFVMGWYHSSTGGPYTLPVTPGPGFQSGTGSNIWIDSCDATNIHVQNAIGATEYVITYAMR